ncbi:MAG TPA: hypothetical protein VFJ16_07390 [Longimicrobium sp.]|nr:hypothetical protein [Longimicrobium sp.]
MGAELGAQVGGRATPQVAAINAVIGYRLYWISDSTAFDACSVYRAAGSQQRVVDGLAPGIRDWFMASAKPCGDAAAGDPRRESRVLVDSLAVSGAVASVYLTVRRGERTHREEYRLMNPTPGLTWAVDRVVLSGAVRNYYVRPGARPASHP